MHKSFMQLSFAHYFWHFSYIKSGSNVYFVLLLLLLLGVGDQMSQE
jgi:hypothetical protein